MLDLPRSPNHRWTSPAFLQEASILAPSLYPMARAQSHFSLFSKPQTVMFLSDYGEYLTKISPALFFFNFADRTTEKCTAGFIACVNLNNSLTSISHSTYLIFSTINASTQQIAQFQANAKVCLAHVPSFILCLIVRICTVRLCRSSTTIAKHNRVNNNVNNIFIAYRN